MTLTGTRDILIQKIKMALPQDVPVYTVKPLHEIGMKLPYILVTQQSGYQSRDPVDKTDCLVSEWRIEIVANRFEPNKVDELAGKIHSAFPSRECLLTEGIKEILLINERDVPPVYNESALCGKEIVYQTTEPLVRKDP
jgi:hypothetical protein